MIVPKTTAKALRLAGTICLALLLSGCVIVPYDPWHPHRYGYWR